ncbi:MAG: ABC transporter permease [Chloroflexi bacterium]|nr:ABC transporter permease [Chloroflexota bacterium]
MKLRLLAAAVLAIHGLVHLIGFVVPWRIAQVEGFAYRTTAVGGSVELGETGALIVGLAWLVIAGGFVIAAIGVWRRSPWALGLTTALATASLVVCVLGLPETVAGITVNVAILAAGGWVAFARRTAAGSIAEGQR